MTPIFGYDHKSFECRMKDHSTFGLLRYHFYDRDDHVSDIYTWIDCSVFSFCLRPFPAVFINLFQRDYGTTLLSFLDCKGLVMIKGGRGGEGNGLRAWTLSEAEEPSRWR